LKIKEAKGQNLQCKCIFGTDLWYIESVWFVCMCSVLVV